MEKDTLSILLALVSTTAGLFIFLHYVPVGLWFFAMANGVRISLLQLVLMRFRSVPPALIVKALVTLNVKGIPAQRDEMEAFYLAGGNVENLIEGMLHARENHADLTLKEVMNLLLDGKSIRDAAENSTKS
ncbi:MAG: flotillin-like FloA family protein [Bacteroidota bacterium]